MAQAPKARASPEFTISRPTVGASKTFPKVSEGQHPCELKLKEDAPIVAKGFVYLECNSICHFNAPGHDMVKVKVGLVL